MGQIFKLSWFQHVLTLCSRNEQWLVELVSLLTLHWICFFPPSIVRSMRRSSTGPYTEAQQTTSVWTHHSYWRKSWGTITNSPAEETWPCGRSTATWEGSATGFSQSKTAESLPTTDVLPPSLISSSNVICCSISPVLNQSFANFQQQMYR